MTTAQIRDEVLRLCPLAEYRDMSDQVGPCHTINDCYDDRYLVYGATSERRAWYEALARLNCIAVGAASI